MKRIITVVCVILVSLSLIGCSKSSTKKMLIGKWELVSGEGENYGIALSFENNGAMYFGLEGLVSDYKSSEEILEAMEQLTALVDIKYKLLSEREMEITVSAFLGLAKEVSVVEYALSGDNLIFDGSVYKRIA